MSNMRKALVLPVLLACCAPVAGVRAASEPTSVDITVKGQIISNTCTVDATKSDLKPTLDTVADRDMKGKGTVKGQKDINIVLTDCGADTTKVEVTAKGTPQDATADANAFSNTGSATGVGLYFYETDGTTKFNPDGSVKETVTLSPDESHNATMTFKAGYVSVADAPAAGDFKSQVTLTLAYL